MERQIAQERQVDAGRAGKCVVDRVAMLIRLVGQYAQRQGEVGGDGHVEFRFAEGGNDNGTVADAARDLFPTHRQFRMQPANRQRPIVRILNIELHGKALLQQISAAHLDTDDRDVRPRELRRQRAAAQDETQGDGQAQCDGQ
jgi:hypothetical protein